MPSFSDELRSIAPKGRSHKRPIRVAFLTPSLGMGGAERWMISLAKHCDSNKIEWVGTVLNSNPAINSRMTSLMSNFMDVYSPPDIGDVDTNEIKQCASLRDAMSRVTEVADILVVWGIPELGEITGKLSIPVVYVSHGSGPWTENAIRSSESSCTHFVSVSHSAASPFSDTIRPSATILHNGIESERCQVEISRSVFRQQWGIPQEAKVIGYIGRFSSEKAPLAAAQIVRRINNPGVIALYCGEGWQSKLIISDVRSLIGDQAIFVPFQENVGNVFNAIDVSILTSPSEGFSLGLTESWYCGTPSVATRVGAVPELEEKHGQLVASVPLHPSPEELVCGVEEALSKKFQTDCVPRAQKLVFEKFTAKKMAERWEDYLLSVARTAVR